MPSITNRCDRCGYDPRTLSPSDGVVAVRSFPRRFGVLLRRPEDEADVVTRRPAPGAPSAVEHAGVVAATLDAVAVALRRVNEQDAPEVRAVTTETSVRGPEDVLAGIEAGAAALADAAGRVAGRDWLRTGRETVTGEEVSALDLLRHAVHVGAHRLREAARAIEQARGAPGG